MSNRLGTGRLTPAGTIFGKLTTLEEARTVAAKIQCRCQCGGRKTVTISNLKNGSTKSCGCLPFGKKRHGMCYHPIWSKWSSMLQRCRDPNADRYESYGGRGITVCERWHTFENFSEDMLPSWKPGLTLERQRVNEGYSPENCVWLPSKLQARNRRTTRWVTVNGQRMSLAEAIEKFSQVSGKTTRARIYELGWSVERALTTPSTRP